MNCANHPEIAAVAYCRTCGKPLCASCKRDVRGVIYCENCLADMLQSVQPPPQVPAAGFVPPPAMGTSRPIEPEGPNPTVAGILAGTFPVGVGAVYTGQYVKGLVHLGILVLLIMGLSAGLPWYVDMTLGILLGFFYFYQIIDSVRSAKAIQMGQPAPDPFGLAQEFGAGERTVDPARVPTAAIVLIGLGLLFLLQTIGLFEFDSDRIWPVFLIGLGVWLLYRRSCPSRFRPGHPYRQRGFVGPAVLITLGTLFLVESLNGPSFHRTWPLLLLVIGAVKLIERQAPPPAPPLAPGGTPPGNTAAQPPASGSEVHHG